MPCLTHIHTQYYGSGPQDKQNYLFDLDIYGQGHSDLMLYMHHSLKPTCPCLFFGNCMSLMNCLGATPPLHTTKPHGIVSPLFSITQSSFTSVK